MSKRNRLTGNAMILTMANAFNRIIGFVYRIVLIRMAGQEAVGLFQMIFPIYFLFLVLASAGLPIAVSKLVSERNARGDATGANAVLRTAAALALIMGLAANALLFASARVISSNLLGDPRTFLAILIIAPSLPLVALSAVYRGYYQGIEEVRVVAGSLISEQTVHVLATLGLVGLTVTRGPVYLSASLAAGSILGEFAGLAVYLTCYPFFRINTQPGTKAPKRSVIVRTLFAISIPATAARLVLSLAQVMNSVIIPSRLRAAGYTASQAAIAFGELTGMSLNLLFVPSLFTISLAATLLPQVSSAAARDDPERARSVFKRALRWTALLSLPCSALFVALGEPLCLFLFNSRTAGQLLSLLAWGGLLLYAQQIAAATLQGLGKPVLPVIASLLGAIIGGLLLYALTPVYLMNGTAFALIAGFCTTGLISLWMVEQRLPFLKDSWWFLVRTLTAAIATGIAAHFIYIQSLALWKQSFAAMTIAGIGAILVYLAALTGLQAWEV